MELLGKEESVKDLDENLLTRRLQEAVYAERPDLLDYGLIIGELDSRLVVTARLENQTVSLYQLVDWLDGEIARNELLLDEADRELFEEIILQTVGQKNSRQNLSSRRMGAQHESVDGNTRYHQRLDAAVAVETQARGNRGRVGDLGSGANLENGCDHFKRRGL